MKRGWIYTAFAIENDGWLNFAGIFRSGKGYVEMEIDEMLKEAKEALNKEIEKKFEDKAMEEKFKTF